MTFPLPSEKILFMSFFLKFCSKFPVLQIVTHFPMDSWFFFVFFLYTYKFVFTLHCKVFYLKLLFWIPSTEDRNNNMHCYLSVYSSPQNFALKQGCDSDPVLEKARMRIWSCENLYKEITTHMYSLKYDFFKTFI